MSGWWSALPVERHPISVSQLSELLGVDPARFVAVQRRAHQWYVVIEPEQEMSQTTGTFPQAHDNTKRKPTKKGPKR